MKKWMWVLIPIVVLGLSTGLYFFKVKPPPPRVDLPEAGQEKIQTLLENRAELHTKKSRYQMIAATYERVLQKSPKDKVARQGLVDTYYQLALIERDLGDLQAARGRIERILTLDPAHAEAKRFLEELQLGSR